MLQQIQDINPQQDDMLKAGVIIFKGRQVTTIPGTANCLNVANAIVNNAFTNNKAKFILNEWYFEITAQEREELRKIYPQIGTATKYLFTEEGFKMLCHIIRSSDMAQLVVQDTINKSSEFSTQAQIAKMNSLLQEAFTRGDDFGFAVIETIKLQTTTLNNQIELQKLEEENHRIEEEHRHIERLREIDIREHLEKERLLLESKKTEFKGKTRQRKFITGKNLVLIKGEMVENSEITFESVSEAARYLGIPSGTVATVALRENKNHFYSKLGVTIQYIDKEEYEYSAIPQRKAG